MVSIGTILIQMVPVSTVVNLKKKETLYFSMINHNQFVGIQNAITGS